MEKKNHKANFSGKGRKVLLMAMSIYLTVIVKIIITDGIPLVPGVVMEKG